MRDVQLRIQTSDLKEKGYMTGVFYPVIDVNLMMLDGCVGSY